MGLRGNRRVHGSELDRRPRERGTDHLQTAQMENRRRLGSRKPRAAIGMTHMLATLTAMIPFPLKAHWSTLHLLACTAGPTTQQIICREQQHCQDLARYAQCASWSTTQKRLNSSHDASGWYYSEKNDIFDYRYAFNSWLGLTHQNPPLAIRILRRS